jgi:dihydroorotate dehydrogenase electron transfer subunit
VTVETRAAVENGRVTRSEDAAPGVGLLAFACASVARAYRPGAFVHLRTGDSTTILRRPFSIARVRGDEVILLYRIIGTGTRWMRALRPGDAVDLMGPLGNAFRPRTPVGRTVLVGGGLGIAPLLGLAETLAATGGAGRLEALLGVRSRGDVFGPTLTDGLPELEWHLATDDGSAGFAGNAAELLESRLAEWMGGAGAAAANERLAIYAAGPEPMLDAVARICARRGLDLQVSMEAHMACGVGACRACGIVPWKDESRIHARVCREGPVFDAAELLWEGAGA